MQPDIVCLAKALGGGLPISAIGGTDEVMSHIVDGTYDQVGTFNGNPLSIAGAKAMLIEVMVEETYEHLDHIQSRMEKGANEVVGRHELTPTSPRPEPREASSIAPSRCAPIEISSQSTAVTPRRPGSISTTAACFLPPWGKGEQWLLSVQHTIEDVDRYLETLDAFASVISVLNRP